MEENTITPQSQIEPSSPPPPEIVNKKPKVTKKLIIIITATLMLAGIIALLYFRGLNNEPEQVACTMEAMLCPDGSSVGRTGPKCEFSPCPTTTLDPNANWIEFISEGFTVKHPPTWTLGQSEYTEDLYMYFSETDTADSENYIVTLSVQNIDIEEATNNLNKGDAGLQNSAEITYDTLNGVKIIKAVSTFSQLDPNTGKYISEPADYIILLPIGEKTIRLSSLLKDKDIIDQILSTFKFTNTTTMPTSTLAPRATYTPTPKPTVNWSTYNDNFGGYSILHPNGWTVKKDFATSITQTMQFTSPDFKESLPEELGISITNLDSGSELIIRTEINGNFKTYDDYRYFMENVSTGSFKNNNREELLINGEKCLFFGNTEWFGGYASACYMTHKGKTYDFVFRNKTTDNSLFKQFLSTLKFTN